MAGLRQPGSGSVEFGAWVEARRPALLRFAYFVADEARAEDLVQDALTGALPRWSRLQDPASAEAYVRRAIVNAAISGWRKDRRVVAVPDPAPHGPSVPDLAVEQVEADAAWRLCRDLPPAQRAAVVLRFYDDQTYAEIATILDCTEATARSHVHRALARLRDQLNLGASDA